MMEQNDRSLPLMGIGNRSRGWPPLRQRRLITPHGDRKPVDVFGDTTKLHPLITPHGDRKPSRPGCRRPPGAAHYPSWGSETFSSRLPSTTRCCSLPLMGIGNPASLRRSRRIARSHYPSWGSETTSSVVSKPRTVTSLPLMGIGNQPLGRRQPHPFRSSLPLMGIGNPSMSSATPRNCTRSLPLMGIGKGMSRPLLNLVG